MKINYIHIDDSLVVSIMNRAIFNGCKLVNYKGDDVEFSLAIEKVANRSANTVTVYCNLKNEPLFASDLCYNPYNIKVTSASTMDEYNVYAERDGKRVKFNSKPLSEKEAIDLKKDIDNSAIPSVRKGSVEMINVKYETSANAEKSWIPDFSKYKSLKIFKSYEEANKFMEKNEEYGALGEEGTEGKGNFKVYVALKTDLGTSTAAEKNGVELPGTNLTIKKFGMDINGNHIITLSEPNKRGFSIQTNGNLPKTHNMKGYKPKELSAEQLEIIAKEVKEHLDRLNSMPVASVSYVYHSEDAAMEHILRAYIAKKFGKNDIAAKHEQYAMDHLSNGDTGFTREDVKHMIETGKEFFHDSGDDEITEIPERFVGIPEDKEIGQKVESAVEDNEWSPILTNIKNGMGVMEAIEAEFGCDKELCDQLFEDFTEAYPEYLEDKAGLDGSDESITYHPEDAAMEHVLSAYIARKHGKEDIAKKHIDYAMDHFSNLEGNKTTRKHIENMVNDGKELFHDYVGDGVEESDVEIMNIAPTSFVGIADDVNIGKSEASVTPKDIKNILLTLNSTIGPKMGKYPIGNKGLTEIVKEYEKDGYIKYNDKYEKWEKASKKSLASVVLWEEEDKNYLDKSFKPAKITIEAGSTANVSLSVHPSEKGHQEIKLRKLTTQYLEKLSEYSNTGILKHSIISSSSDLTKEQVESVKKALIAVGNRNLGHDRLREEGKEGVIAGTNIPEFAVWVSSDCMGETADYLNDNIGDRNEKETYMFAFEKFEQCLLDFYKTEINKSNFEDKLSFWENLVYNKKALGAKTKLNIKPKTKNGTEEFTLTISIDSDEYDGLEEYEAEKEVEKAIKKIKKSDKSLKEDAITIDGSDFDYKEDGNTFIKVTVIAPKTNVEKWEKELKKAVDCNTDANVKTEAVHPSEKGHQEIKLRKVTVQHLEKLAEYSNTGILKHSIISENSDLTKEQVDSVKKALVAVGNRNLGHDRLREEGKDGVIAGTDIPEFAVWVSSDCIGETADYLNDNIGERNAKETYSFAMEKFEQCLITFYKTEINKSNFEDKIAFWEKIVYTQKALGSQELVDLYDELIGCESEHSKNFIKFVDFDAQVSNGGISQYITNGYVKDIESVKKFLDSVNKEKCKELVDRLDKLSNLKDIYFDEAEDSTIELVEKEWDEFDTFYFSIRENVISEVCKSKNRTEAASAKNSKSKEIIEFLKENGFPVKNGKSVYNDEDTQYITNTLFIMHNGEKFILAYFDMEKQHEPTDIASSKNLDSLISKIKKELKETKANVLPEKYNCKAIYDIAGNKENVNQEKLLAKAGDSGKACTNSDLIYVIVGDDRLCYSSKEEFLCYWEMIPEMKYYDVNEIVETIGDQMPSFLNQEPDKTAASTNVKDNEWNWSIYWGFCQEKCGESKSFEQSLETVSRIIKVKLTKEMFKENYDEFVCKQTIDGVDYLIVISKFNFVLTEKGMTKSSTSSWKWVVDYKASEDKKSEDYGESNDSGEANTLNEALIQIGEKFNIKIEADDLCDNGDKLTYEKKTYATIYSVVIHKPNNEKETTKASPMSYERAQDIHDDVLEDDVEDTETKTAGLYTIYLKNNILDDLALDITSKFNIEASEVGKKAINVYTSDKEILSKIIEFIGNSEIVKISPI